MNIAIHILQIPVAFCTLIIRPSMQAGKVCRLASNRGIVYPRLTMASTIPQASVADVVSGKEPRVVYLSPRPFLSIVSRMPMPPRYS